MLRDLKDSIKVDQNYHHNLLSEISEHTIQKSQRIY